MALVRVSDANRAVDRIVKTLQVKKFIKLSGESYLLEYKY
jgi:hypothetical protein